MITFNDNQEGMSKGFFSLIAIVAILVISFFIISFLYFGKNKSSELVENESKPSLENEITSQQKADDIGSEELEAADIAETEIKSSDSLDDGLYSNAKGGFSIKPPKGWIKDENYRGDVYVIFRDNGDKSPRAKEFTNNIVITTPTKSECGDISDYINRYGEKAITMLLKDYKKIDARFVTAGGHNARLLTGTYTGVFNDGTETKLNLAVLMTCKDNKVYQINANVYSSDWERNKKAIEASLLTFELK